MSIKETKRQEASYILAAVAVVAFCIYLMSISLSGYPSGEQNKQQFMANNLATLAAADKEKSDEADTESSLTDVDTSDTADSPSGVAIDDDDEAVVEGNAELGVDIGPVQKRVTLLTITGEPFTTVCFEAADESIFMGYGWPGLASQALEHINEVRDLDDIKIDISSDCSGVTEPVVVLERNPLEVAVPPVV